MNTIRPCWSISAIALHFEHRIISAYEDKVMASSVLKKGEFGGNWYLANLISNPIYAEMDISFNSFVQLGMLVLKKEIMFCLNFLLFQSWTQPNKGTAISSQSPNVTLNTMSGNWKAWTNITLGLVTNQYLIDHTFLCACTAM